MKSLIIVIALILAVILAMGGLSSLSGSLSDVVSTTTVAGTTETIITSISGDSYKPNSFITVYPYLKDDVSIGAKIASYDNGEAVLTSDPFVPTRLGFGYAINQSSGATMLCFQVSGLSLNSTYYLRVSLGDIPSTFDSYNLSCRLVTDDRVDIPFDTISNSASVSDYTFSVYTTGSDFHIGLLSFPDLMDEQALQNYASLLKKYISVEVYYSSGTLVDAFDVEVIL